MSFLSAIQTIKTQVPKQYLVPSLRDAGVDYMESHLGGCTRACWYKIHGVEPTNPPDEAYVLNMKMDETIREIYRNKFKQASSLEIKAPYEFTVGIGDYMLQGHLDVLYTEGNKNIGVLIFCGHGYGFTIEIFGSKNREGKMKDDHLALASNILHFCPVPLTRVEVVYVERGNISNAMCYSIDRPVFAAKEASQELTAAIADSRPGCSFEKSWTDPVKVASLYADKKISKERYTTWKEGGVGGDWQCDWCSWRSRCTKDDMKTGSGDKGDIDLQPVTK